METKHIIIIILLITISALIGGIASLIQNNHPSQDIIINDINIVPDTYGYRLIGHITPLVNYDYLEARIEYFDTNNVIIHKDSTAWNIVHVKSNEELGINHSAYFTGNPSYATVSFYNSISSTKPITSANITFN